MEDVSRRSFLGLSALGVAGLVTSRGWSLQAVSAKANDELYRAFLEPGREFSIRPFWFWNGALDAAELRRQMKEMIDHGVYGAYAHNRDGLETPYLSDAWWTVVGEALQAAEELGFSLCLVDEFEWPSGEARDYWMPGPQKSRVVKANADFHMKRLRPVEQRVQGPKSLRVELNEGTAHVVVGRSLGPARLDGASLRSLPMTPNAKQMTWEVPEGDWIVFQYVLEDTIGPDHGSVDLMSHEAVAEYIKIYYEEFHRRHGKHFGKAMPSTFADHEGTYGGRLPWTPRLLQSFQAAAGYDLVPMLPALTYDVGARTEKIRCDLLDTVSELYSSSFWQQVTDWCEAHGVQHTGHVWEETLFFGPALQGDFFRVLRSMTNPGCDTLLEWGRQSVWLKENASVADMEGKHVVCENQGVQGETSYLSPERMRRVSNGLGAWNVGEFVPHAFDYDLARTNYPPDWFRSQPYLRWFKAYADQMRRISFMNRDSHEVAEIVLLYPQVSIWGQSAPAFRDDRFDYIERSANWSYDARQTNERYAELKLLLSKERLAYQIADDHYFSTARVEGGTLAIAKSRFKVIVLPPMSTIRRGTAQRIAEFLDGGGVVFAIEQLPMISVEFGREDPMLREIWSRFVTTNHVSTAPSQARGRAYLFEGSETDLVAMLKQRVPPDAEIVSGPTEDLFALRKQKQGAEFFWLVNDSAIPRVNLLEFPVQGRPERWDAETGLRAPLFYQSTQEGTRVRLKLDAWDAAYVVFDLSGAPQPLQLESSNLDDFHVVREDAKGVTVHVNSILPVSGGSLVLLKEGRPLKATFAAPGTGAQVISGPWQVSVEASTILAPYALAMDDFADQGMKARWFARGERELPWQELWLSPMRYALQSWNVIGPFPNEGDLGLEKSFAPEREVTLNKQYEGDQGVSLRWVQVHAERYHVSSVGGLDDIGLVELRGGPYGDVSHIVDWATPLGLPVLSGTFYAQTNVYLPEAGTYRLLLATGSPRAVFVNGRQVYSRWVRPLYNVLDDAFAAKMDVEMKAGWNSVLVKLLQNPSNEVEGRFFCRLESKQGKVIDGQLCATESYQPDAPLRAAGYRWLRFEVPPLAAALHVPALRHPYTVFVDGSAVAASRSVALPPTATEVTLRVDGSEILDTPFTFATRRGELELGTWMRPGWRNFSGEMSYEKDVQITADMLSEDLLLDCGEVGVVAEAWLNDQYLGSRAWSPFAFNLSPHAHVGTNRLRVRVANTDGNARAVGPSRTHLAAIDVSGWHGPARLVPALNRDVVLR